MDQSKVRELLKRLDDPNVSPVVKKTIQEGIEKAMTGGFKAAYQDQLRYRARTDLDAFAEYVFGLKQYPHHREITNILQDTDERETLFILNPGAGKCGFAGTLVEMADGTRRRLDEVDIGDRVACVDLNTLKNACGRVLWKEHTGTKECFKVITRSGFEVEVTADHRLYTFDGWKECRDLQEGDFLAAPRELPWPTPTEFLDDNEVKLLAYWIAEGCRDTSAGRVAFSNCDESILLEGERCASALGYSTSRIRLDDRVKGLRINKGSSPHHPRELLHKYGLDPKTDGAFEKRVPDTIFKAPKESVALFLNRLFACDGCIERSKKRTKDEYSAKVSYCSVSRRLTDDIRTLLLRFGINCSVRTKAPKLNGKTFKAFELTINEGQAVHKFMEQIGVYTKDATFELYKDTTRRTPLNSEVDRIPSGWRSQLHRPAHYYEYHHKIRVAKPGGTYRGKVAAVAELEDNEGLLRLAQSDIRWDPIVSVRSVGEVETYDIEVEDHHNFYAHGLLSHNSTQLNQVFLPWWMGNNVNMSSILLSSSQSQSVKFSSMVRSVITSNKKYAEVFPDVSVDPLMGESREQIYLQRSTSSAHPNLFSAGMRSSKVLGSRAELIIVDDPLTQVQARSDLELQNQKEWFQGTLMTRLDPDTGRVVVILTRWHNGDLASLLMNRLNFKVVHMPALGDDMGAYINTMPPLVHNAGSLAAGTTSAIEALDNINTEDPLSSLPKDLAEDYMGRLETIRDQDRKEGFSSDIKYSHENRRYCVKKYIRKDNDKSIWPERFSEDYLLRQKANKGSVSFNLLYQGDPTSLEGDIFKRDWFEYFGDGESPDGKVPVKRRIPSDATYFMSVDPAISQKTSADYFVVVIAARDKEGNYYIVHVLRTRLEAPDQKRAIKRLYQKYSQTVWILIESVAFQQALFQDLLRDGLPCRKYVPRAGKDKEMRARSASVLFEAGKVHLPTNAPWLSDFTDELTGFPRSEKDDQVDCVSSLLEEVSLQFSHKTITYQVGFGL